MRLGPAWQLQQQQQQQWKLRVGRVAVVVTRALTNPARGSTALLLLLLFRTSSDAGCKTAPSQHSARMCGAAALEVRGCGARRGGGAALRWEEKGLCSSLPLQCRLQWCTVG